jgi:hypothetical protein
MKRAILIAAVCAFVAVPALADMSVIVANSPGGANNGGPFTATVQAGDSIGENAPGASFSTFCLEHVITFTPGNLYYVTVDADAMTGGGGPNPDPVSDETAWLYTNYLDGTLSYLAGSYTDYEKRSAVQEAIWRIEQEGTLSNPVNVAVLAADLVLQAGAAVGTWSNTNIMAMNLWANEDHTGDAQSMLVRVPVPAAVWLGLLGLGAAGAKLRRRAA